MGTDDLSACKVHQTLVERRSNLRLKTMGYGALTSVSLLCLRKPQSAFIKTPADYKIYTGRYLIVVGASIFLGCKTLQTFCKSCTTSKRINFKNTGYMQYSSLCDDEK